MVLGFRHRGRMFSEVIGFRPSFIRRMKARRTPRGLRASFFCFRPGPWHAIRRLPDEVLTRKCYGRP